LLSVLHGILYYCQMNWLYQQCSSNTCCTHTCSRRQDDKTTSASLLWQFINTKLLYNFITILLLNLSDPCTLEAAKLSWTTVGGFIYFDIGYEAFISKRFDACGRHRLRTVKFMHSLYLFQAANLIDNNDNWDNWNIEWCMPLLKSRYLLRSNDMNDMIERV